MSIGFFGDVEVRGRFVGRVWDGRQWESGLGYGRCAWRH